MKDLFLRLYFLVMEKATHINSHQHDCLYWSLKTARDMLKRRGKAHDALTQWKKNRQLTNTGSGRTSFQYWVHQLLKQYQMDSLEKCTQKKLYKLNTLYVSICIYMQTYLI